MGVVVGPVGRRSSVTVAVLSSGRGVVFSNVHVLLCLVVVVGSDVDVVAAVAAVVGWRWRHLLLCWLGLTDDGGGVTLDESRSC